MTGDQFLRNFTIEQHQKHTYVKHPRYNWDVCNNDGGDCCGEFVNTMFCNQCFCMEGLEITDECLFKEMAGDGACNDFANVRECAFDNGKLSLIAEEKYYFLSAYMYVCKAIVARPILTGACVPIVSASTT